jgi:Peptidase family M23
MNYTTNPLISRRRLLAGLTACLCPQFSFSQTNAGCADDLGDGVERGDMYSIEEACFTNAGWFAPVQPLDGTALWTSKAYDFKSDRYRRVFGFEHGGIDLVGSQLSPNGGDGREYTSATPVYAIGSGIIRYIRRETKATFNLSNIIVEHTALDGTQFIALYMHCYAEVELNRGDEVEGGQVLGYLRSYNTPFHLHFQIDTLLTRVSTGGWQAGSTQKPVGYLLQHPGPNELTLATSQERYYANYLRNAIDLGMYSNTDPLNKAWTRATFPIKRAELITILRRIADAYRPGWVTDIPLAQPAIDPATLFPADSAFRSTGGQMWQNVSDFALRGLVSSGQTFRPYEVATIGEAMLFLWRMFRFPIAAGTTSEAYGVYRRKLQRAEVATPLRTGYSLPAAATGSTSDGYSRAADLSLIRTARRGWGAEAILTSEFFTDYGVDPRGTDATGYSLPVNRGILAKLGINIIKFMAQHGSNANTTLNGITV